MINNSSQFATVRILIWDFDGTLFAPIEGLMRDIIESDYRVVMEHNGWDREKTVAEFGKIYKVVTPSSTETAAILAHIPVAQAALECEEYKDRTKYLSHDGKLITLFQHLGGYKQYMLANGMKKKIVESLRVLGLAPETFTEIVTSETVGVNKPHPDGFQYIIKQTGLPADAHMMIGDREAVDIAPAKALGMHTCLVWNDEKSTVADISLPTVYDVGKLFV